VEEFYLMVLMNSKISCLLTSRFFEGITIGSRKEEARLDLSKYGNPGKLLLLDDEKDKLMQVIEAKVIFQFLISVE
jgi:hypothetical protein